MPCRCRTFGSQTSKFVPYINVKILQICHKPECVLFICMSVLLLHHRWRLNTDAKQSMSFFVYKQPAGSLTCAWPAHYVIDTEKIRQGQYFFNSSRFIGTTDLNTTFSAHWPLQRTSHSFNENQPMHRKRSFLKIFCNQIRRKSHNVFFYPHSWYP